jgi:hypothetical protein
VSLFRESDHTVIAGDAVTTTRQESVFAVMTQREELNGPPAYFTIDWQRAHQSTSAIAALRPSVLATGHGAPMRGPAMLATLTALARDFEVRARPRHGRYVETPAVTDERGVVAIPPAPRAKGVRWGALSGVAAATFAGTWLIRRYARHSRMTE